MRDWRDLEKILEIGVDEMSWDDMSKNEMHWPKVSVVREYRQTVYNLIVDLIKNHPDLDKKGNFTFIDMFQGPNNNLVIQWCDSERPEYQVVGKIILCCIPWTAAMKPKSSGFLEDD